jgi:hypothetical protein
MSARILPLSLALALAAVACDHVAEAPPSAASVATVTAPVLSGTLYDAHLALVPDAELVAEFVAADGATVIGEAFATSDAQGSFAFESMPADAASVNVHVFAEGRHVATRDVAIAHGQPNQAHLAVIFASSPLCPAVTWATAKAGGGSDKMMHCVASCRTVRWCGSGWGTTAANLKERLDEACRTAPQWVKDLLRPVSGCGGWSAEDMKANQDGFGCAKGPWWRTCERCCDAIW